MGGYFQVFKETVGRNFVGHTGLLAGSSEILHHPWCVKVVNSVIDVMSISAVIFPSTVSRDVWCFTYFPGLKEISQKVLFKMIFRFPRWDVGRYVFGVQNHVFWNCLVFRPRFWVWNPLWQFCFVEHTNCFKFSVVNLMTPDIQKIWPFIEMETQCFFPTGPMVRRYAFTYICLVYFDGIHVGHIQIPVNFDMTFYIFHAGE